MCRGGWWTDVRIRIYLTRLPSTDISMSCWMDVWLTYFGDSNPVLFIILFWSLSLCWSATHSCGILWYLSRHPLLILLLITFLSLLFISISLFYVTWVCLWNESHEEVSKSLKNRSLIWFSQEIPIHLTCVSQLHWHTPFVNPVS